MISSEVVVEIGDLKRTTRARVVSDPVEDAKVRQLLVEKYRPRYRGDLTTGGRPRSRRDRLDLALFETDREHPLEVVFRVHLEGDHVSVRSTPSTLEMPPGMTFARSSCS